MSKKRTLIIFLLVLTFAIALPSKVNANLQSRPNATSLKNKSASDFFLLSRQMETSSGPMGLNASIEVQNDKVVETTEPNNIDVHMIKNTEYGTALLLSASAYGECTKDSNKSTTSTTRKFLWNNANGTGEVNLL